MVAKYELKKSADGQFLFNLKAPNGEKILTSETYKSKKGAEDGIGSVKTNAARDDRYERLKSSKNEPYFVLKAANGEIIGKSEMYSSESAMESGIKSVKLNGPTAGIEDLT
jgi:uncharacterized protein YegP (UPF0339 family)